MDILASSSGQTDVLTHHNDTGNAAPIRQPVRRVPLPHRGKVQELFNDMLRIKINFNT